MQKYAGNITYHTRHAGLSAAWENVFIFIKALLLSSLAMNLIFISLNAAETPSIKNFTDTLTEKEKIFLKNNPVINIGMDNQNPPMNFRNHNGKLDGVSVDYLKEIEKRLGIKIELHGDNWNNALKKAMEHKFDGIANATPLKERRTKLNFSVPYFKTPFVFVTRINAGTFTSLSDFCDKKIAVVRGSFRVGLIKTKCPGTEIIEVEYLKDGLKAVSEGRVDAYFDDLPVVSYTLQEHLYTNLKIALHFELPKFSDCTFALRNDKPELLTLFNKAMRSVPKSTSHEIRTKWFHAAHTALVYRNIGLTPHEKKWLELHPKITYTGDPEYAPIEEWPAEEAPRGISIDYLREIGRILGVNFIPVRSDNWENALQSMQNRKTDFLVAASITPAA